MIIVRVRAVMPQIHTDKYPAENSWRIERRVGFDTWERVADENFATRPARPETWHAWEGTLEISAVMLLYVRRDWPSISRWRVLIAWTRARSDAR